MDSEVVAEMRRDLILGLQDDLYVSDVGIVDGLIEEGYLSSNDWQAIHGVHRHKKKVKILINCLSRSSCPANAFMCLLEKLKRSHEHLVPVVARILGRVGKVANTPTHRQEAVEHGDIVNYNYVTSLNDQMPNDHGIKEETLNNTNKSLGTSGRCPFSETGNGQNGRTPVVTESSWQSYIHIDNSRFQVIQKNKQLADSLQKPSHTNEIVSKNVYTADRCNRNIEENIDIHQRNGEEHSYYGLDEIDSVDFCTTDVGLLDSDNSRFMAKCKRVIPNIVEVQSDSGNGIPQVNGNNCTSQNPRRDISEIMCWVSQPKQSRTGEENSCQSVRESIRKISCRYSVTNSPEINTKSAACEANTDYTKAIVNVDDKVLGDIDNCQNCTNLRRNTCKTPRNYGWNVIRKSDRNCRRNSTYSNKAMFELLISSSDTDSEINTEVLTSELDDEELGLLGVIEGGDISDVVDVCIQSGVLSSDDYNLIHGTPSKRRKSAILTRLLSENAGKGADFPKSLKQINNSCVQKHGGEIDECDGAVACDEETGNIALLRVLHSLPPAGQRVIKDLDVVFDKFNTMLNNGVLQVDELPENPNVQCIVHFLKACDYLYQSKYELAKKHIKATDVLLPKTDYPIQLRSEFFTAKTWLCLRTDKLGKMLRLLEENEQNIKSFPDHWPNTAKGWFYFDFCRCYEAMLRRALFNGKYNKHSKTGEWYRQRAIESAKRAMDYFRVSDSSDGPIGSGFAWCKLADLHLLTYSNTPVTKINISGQDLVKAETAIEEVEKLPGGIPDVLNSCFLLSKCRHMIRAGNLSSACETAIEGEALSERLQIPLDMKECEFLLDYIGHSMVNRCNKIRHLDLFQYSKPSANRTLPDRAITSVRKFSS